MRFYPVMLDLRDREVVVVGGGAVAERKVREMIEAGARVRVISPDVTPALAQLGAEGRIVVCRKPFDAADLEGAWLVIGATPDAAVNRAVAEEAARRRLFCNIVDQTTLCSFLVPAVVRRGAVTIAISTGGMSPALAVRLKHEVAAHIGPEYGALATLLGRMRSQIQKLIPDPKRRALCFRRLVASNLLDLLRVGRTREAERLAWRLVRQWACSTTEANLSGGETP
jgi:siroheme synthase-like protein